MLDHRVEHSLQGDGVTTYLGEDQPSLGGGQQRQGELVGIGVRGQIAAVVQPVDRAGLFEQAADVSGSGRIAEHLARRVLAELPAAAGPRSLRVQPRRERAVKRPAGACQF
ncbi:MAG TPA: hypothetical protein VHZ54_19750 [Solirubrobacterales bacterium]|nr:hypothetical protein [Solirubrobacterales bacterium]